MHRVNLTQYDTMPESMVNYFRYNGPHFNRKLCDFAVSFMTKEVKGKEKQIKPYSKEEVEDILKNYDINLENNQLYDFVYVANMCKADFLESSVPDEEHLARYIKDVIDDVDGYDGIVFNRWYADMCYKGIPIDWEEML